MDVYGKNPQNEKGKYFRNSVWWWRPLWSLIIKLSPDILTIQDATAGSYNDGYYIPPDKSKAILERLIAFVSDKKKNQTVIDEIIESFRRPEETESSYPLDWENIESFIEFISNSEGFEIY